MAGDDVIWTDDILGREVVDASGALVGVVDDISVRALLSLTPQADADGVVARLAARAVGERGSVAGLDVDPADPACGARALVEGGVFVHGEPDVVVKELDAYRAAGAAEGREAGSAKGAEEGYAEGFKQGREQGYEATYADAYRKAYEKEFKDAGLEVPQKISVPQSQ